MTTKEVIIENELGLGFVKNEEGLAFDLDGKIKVVSSNPTTFPYASFHLQSGGLTNVSNVERALIINQTGVNSDTSKYSLSNNEVTVTDAGDYDVSFNCYFNSSGSSRSEYLIRMLVNDVEMPGLRAGTYQRGFDSGDTASIRDFVELPAGAKIKFVVVRSDGTGTEGYQENNGTRFSIKRLG